MLPKALTELGYPFRRCKLFNSGRGAAVEPVPPVAKQKVGDVTHKASFGDLIYIRSSTQGGGNAGASPAKVRCLSGHARFCGAGPGNR